MRFLTHFKPLYKRKVRYVVQNCQGIIYVDDLTLFYIIHAPVTANVRGSYRVTIAVDREEVQVLTVGNNG